MNSISKKILSFVFFALSLIFVYQSASACQVDELYLTKDGYMAAFIPDDLKEGLKYEKNGEREKLDKLIKSGQVIILKENTKARVLERSFELRMLKIELSEDNNTYWVNDGSLKPCADGTQ